MPATPPRLNARSRLGEIGRDIGNDPLIFLSLLSAPIGKLPVGIGGVFLIMVWWFERFKYDLGQGQNYDGFNNSIYGSWELMISFIVSFAIIGLSAYATWGKKDKPNVIMLILVLAFFLPAVFIPFPAGIGLTILLVLGLALVWWLIMRHLPSTMAIFGPLLIMVIGLFVVAAISSWLAIASATGGNLNPGYSQEMKATRVYQQMLEMTPTAAAMQTAWCAENCGPLAATQTAWANYNNLGAVVTPTPRPPSARPSVTPTRSPSASSSRSPLISPSATPRE